MDAECGSSPPERMCADRWVGAEVAHSFWLERRRLPTGQPRRLWRSTKPHVRGRILLHCLLVSQSHWGGLWKRQKKISSACSRSQSTNSRMPNTLATVDWWFRSSISLDAREATSRARSLPRTQPRGELSWSESDSVLSNMLKRCCCGLKRDIESVTAPPNYSSKESVARKGKGATFTLSYGSRSVRRRGNASASSGASQGIIRGLAGTSTSMELASC